MAELLVLNPSKRGGKKRRSTKRTRARRRNPVASLARRRSSRSRHRNPIAALSRRRTYRRRRNPIALRRSALGGRRRRRNPISMGRVTGSAIIKMLVQAGIGGAGAIAVDTAWARVQGFLPSTVQTNPASVGLGDGLKAGLTAALGILLNRVTRGLSATAAAGSLAVQARDVIAKAMPSLALKGLGFYTPGAVINSSARIGPNRAFNGNGAGAGMGAYLPPGASPLLNGSVRGGIGAYTRPGVTPLLNGRMPAQQREGFRR